MNDKKKDNIRRILSARSIVVIGGTHAEESAKQSIRMGFEGDIYCVHPRRTEMAGLKCYPSLSELPNVPDVAFIGVPNTMTVSIVKELSDMGVGGAVCYASGFSECDAKGEALQKQLLENAGDMAIIGPNCYGSLNYLNGACLWPDQHGGERCDKGVAIITQSGNIGLNMTFQKRGLDIAYTIAVGNKADLDFCDYVDALLDDDNVTAIGLHIEDLGDVQKFSHVAIRAWEKAMPIVVIKAGKSEVGAQITMSHTSSLAGANDFYDAFFLRYNIIAVDSISDFMETLKLLHISGAPINNSYVSMSCSGGEASLSADMASNMGLDLVEFSSATTAALQSLLGEMVSVRNTLDYHTFIWGDVEKTQSMLDILYTENISTMAMILDYPNPERCALDAWHAVENAMILSKKLADEKGCNSKLVMITTLNESMPQETIKRLKGAGITPLFDFENAMRAIQATGQWSMRRKKELPLPLSITNIVVNEGQLLNEYNGKKAVEEFGLSIPNSIVVKEGGYEHLNSLSYPVVVKILSTSIAHKTDVGGVQLKIQNQNEVISAIEKMKHLADTFLVEEMVDDVLCELIIGIKRDNQFGLGLVIGTGGVLVEVLQDSQLLLLPSNKEDIKEALSTLKIFPMLNGYRGAQKANMDKCIDSIDAVVQYAVFHQNSILELDINPLFVGVDATVAGDVLIRLNKPI